MMRRPLGDHFPRPQRDDAIAECCRLIQVVKYPDDSGAQLYVQLPD